MLTPSPGWAKGAARGQGGSRRGRRTPSDLYDRRRQRKSAIPRGSAQSVTEGQAPASGHVSGQGDGYGWPARVPRGVRRGTSACFGRGEQLEASLAVLAAASRRGGRVVDRAALEMRSTGNRTGGSNPSLSAICLVRAAKATREHLLKRKLSQLIGRLADLTISAGLLPSSPSGDELGHQMNARHGGQARPKRAFCRSRAAPQRPWLAGRPRWGRPHPKPQ